MKSALKIKSLIGAILCALLLPLALTGCKTDPPELDTVRDRFEELIEASHEINDIFFGDGLPTYDRDDSDYDSLYYGFFGYDAYEIVANNSPYQSIEQIKAAAEKVYSPDYLEDIYTMAFDGYSDENSTAVTTARYLHTGEHFLKYAFGKTDSFDILNGKRIYRYDTMQIGKLSTGEAVNLEIETYLEGQEDKAYTETLRFVLVDGEWFLDEPTY